MWPDGQKPLAVLGMQRIILSRGKYVPYFYQYQNICLNIQYNCYTLKTSFLPSFLSLLRHVRVEQNIAQIRQITNANQRVCHHPAQPSLHYFAAHQFNHLQLGGRNDKHYQRKHQKMHHFTLRRVCSNTSGRKRLSNVYFRCLRFRAGDSSLCAPAQEGGLSLTNETGFEGRDKPQL